MTQCKSIVLPKPVWDPSHVKNNQVAKSASTDHLFDPARKGCHWEAAGLPRVGHVRATFFGPEKPTSHWPKYNGNCFHIGSRTTPFPILSRMTDYPKTNNGGRGRLMEEFGGKTKQSPQNPPPFPSRLNKHRAWFSVSRVKGRAKRARSSISPPRTV